MDAEVGQQPPPRPEAERGGDIGAMEVGLAGAQKRIGRRQVGPRGVRPRPGRSARRRARPREVGRQEDQAERPGRRLQSFWIVTCVAVTLAKVVVQAVRLPRTCTLAPGLRLALQSVLALSPLHL